MLVPRTTSRPTAAKAGMTSSLYLMESLLNVPRCNAIDLSNASLDFPKNEGGIDDHGHRAVAHDRRSGDAGDAAQHRAGGLDDDLRLAEDLVHDQTRAGVLVFDDDHHFTPRPFAAEPEERPHADERNGVAAHVHHAAGAGVAVGLGALQTFVDD